MHHTRILIVEDDPQAHTELRLLLRGEGYVVELAKSGADALRLVAHSPPDLVLTDLKMPGMDGITLCRLLQAQSPVLPVIVVTALADSSSAVRALHAGAEDYLTKPVNFDELLVSIQRAIERRAASVERQHLRARTEELYQQALAAMKANEDVLSLVAHELRNPLGVIALGAQQLLQSAPPNALGEGAHSGLSAISRSATRMQRLISDLLDESRIGAGRLPLQCGHHLLSEILADVSELRPLAQQKRVIVDIRPPERDRAIFCDRGRINQVLGNLLMNAIKFSPTGGKVIITVEDEGAGARFAVRDQGPGIAPDAVPKVFDRFWQAKKGGGVGLGLYIVKGIVEAHGGLVSVESRLGSGTDFYVSLPETCTACDASAKLGNPPTAPPQSAVEDARAESVG